MFLKYLENSILAYCNAIDDFDIKNSELTESEIKPTIVSIQKLTNELGSQDVIDPIIFSELEYKVKELSDLSGKVKEDALKVHSNVIGTLVKEFLIQEFIHLSPSEQENILHQTDITHLLKEALQSNHSEIHDEEIGDTLLHKLCSSDSGVVRKLAIEFLKDGSDVNTPNKKGVTVLHLAAQKGDIELISALLSKGADPTVKTLDNHSTPLDILFSHKELDNKSCEQFLQLFDKFSETPQFNQLVDKLWEGCKVIVDINLERVSNSNDEIQLQEVYDNVERIIVKMLEKTPPLHVSTEAQITCLDGLASLISQRRMKGPHDCESITNLVRHHLLAFMSDSSALLRTLLHHSLVPQEIKELATVQMNDQTVKLLKGLTSDEFKFEKAQTFEKLSLLEQIDDKIRQLKGLNFPQLEFLEKKLETITGDFRKKIDHFVEVKRGLSEGSTPAAKVTSDFLIYLAYQKDWELVVKASTLTRGITHKKVVNKAIFHLMMDKLHFKGLEKYESFNHEIPAHILIHILERIRKLENKEDAEAIFNELALKLKPLLVGYISLSPLRIHNTKAGAHRILEGLANLNVGESLLVPSGSNNHGTNVLVTKSGNGKFSLTHYNTGLGVLEWHAHWEETNKYQTYYAIDDIPETSLLQMDHWEDLLNRKDSMDPSYVIIRDKLGKGGQIRPASKDPEDYESIQHSGTCTLQCLMALLRHQCMQMAWGTPGEKNALYKLMKTEMLTSYYQDNIHQVDPVINKQVFLVMSKLQAEKQMVEIAGVSEKFEAAMNEFQAMLKKYGNGEIAKSLAEATRNAQTTLSRYSVLRSASIILSGLWFESKDIPQDLSDSQREVMKLAVAKFNYRTAVQSNILTKLDNFMKAKDIKKVIDELYQTLILTGYDEFAINEFIKRFGNETSNTFSGSKELLDLLNHNHSQNNSKVNRLVNRLEDQNKAELATWMKTYWENQNILAS